MDIYLVRHGVQVAKERDPNEPLSEEGRKLVETTAKILKREGIIVDAIASSPKARAQQTAQILANHLDYDTNQIQEDARLKPLSPVEESIELLSNLGDRILIAGHLPSLQLIASFLLTHREAINIDFQCAGCAKIEIDNINNRNGRLIWLFSPQLIDSTS